MGLINSLKYIFQTYNYKKRLSLISNWPGVELSSYRAALWYERLVCLAAFSYL